MEIYPFIYRFVYLYGYGYIYMGIFGPVYIREKPDTLWKGENQFVVPELVAKNAIAVSFLVSGEWWQSSIKNLQTFSGSFRIWTIFFSFYPFSSISSNRLISDTGHLTWHFLPSPNLSFFSCSWSLARTAKNALLFQLFNEIILPPYLTRFCCAGPFFSALANVF